MEMKLLIVDDHTVVREGLRRLLPAFLEVTIFDASSGSEAITLFRTKRPDLVLLDINLPGLGGLDLLRRLLLIEPKARVLMLSMHVKPVYVARALEAGAQGYISKGAKADELIEAVRTVAGGGRYIEHEIASELALSLTSASDAMRSLSARELDVMRLLAEGKNLNGISQDLGISYKTVANICTGIKQKMMVENTSELIKLAVEMHRG
jgi:two-component system, NarL family, invasion response regulator UvrY